LHIFAYFALQRIFCIFIAYFGFFGKNDAKIHLYCTNLVNFVLKILKTLVSLNSWIRFFWKMAPQPSSRAALLRQWIGKFPEGVYTTDGPIILAITKLETQGLPMTEVADILLEVRNSLDNASGEIGTKIRQKWDKVIDRNPGFIKMSKIGRVLSGQIVNEFDMPPNVITRFKFAPLTSCDVERSFSLYKTILTDRRTSFTPENIEMYLVANCELNYDS